MALRVCAVAVVAAVWCAPPPALASHPDTDTAWAQLQSAVQAAQAALQEQTRVLQHLLNATNKCHACCSQEWWCPPPYKRVLAECFYLSPTIMTWQKARSHCQDLAGDLATPAVVARLFSFALDNGAKETDRVWVGGTDRRRDWLWLNGRSIPLADWAVAQPNNWDGDQHCLTVLLNDRPSLNDANCDLEYLFACQYPRHG